MKLFYRILLAWLFGFTMQRLGQDVSAQMDNVVTVVNDEETIIMARGDADITTTYDDMVTSSNSTNVFRKGDASRDGGTSILPPIYVLNLDRARDRWEQSWAQMKAAGLENHVSRLPAIDGRKLSREELEKESTKLALFLQPRGVIGCYLSHKSFWQYVVDNELDRAIIFEDDIQLVAGFKEKLIDNLKRLDPRDAFDVAFLGAIGRVHPQGKENFGSFLFGSYMGGNRRHKSLSDSFYQPKRPAGTHAYMVTQQGARKLLTLCKRATFHVDLDAWRHSSLELRMFNPMLVYQTFETSTLTDVDRKRGKVGNALVSSRAVQRLHAWARDPYTLQPWSHVLAEPMLQLGPGGLVINVERFCIVLGTGCVSSLILVQAGLRYWAKVVFGSTVGLFVSMRSLIWLLMNWK